MMFYGMGAAVAVRVSNFHGQGDTPNVRRVAYAGFHLILFMEVVLLSIVFACRSRVGGLVYGQCRGVGHGVGSVLPVPYLSVWRRSAD